MFDLQVNGYAGTDFNRDGLTAEALHHACLCLQTDGVAGILATVITDDLPLMERRLQRIVELREHDDLAKEMIVGLHVEGPFISNEKGYVGAHPPGFVRSACVEGARRLWNAAGGFMRLMTLAPECDAGFSTTQWLAQQGVCVSAGHCNPSLDLLRAATDHGLRMFTHVGNGCPMLLPRHENIIQRALSLQDRLWLCFIPDGVHIEFHALKNYLRAAGLERSIFVTDAISAARLGPGKYTLAGWDIAVGADLVARAPDGSHFIGSTLTWPRLQVNATHLDVNPADLLNLALHHPRAALGLPELTVSDIAPCAL